MDKDDVIKIASTVVVASYSDILLSSYSDEINEQITTGFLFEYLEYDYSEYERIEISSAQSFEKLSSRVRLKILSDWFNDNLRVFSANQCVSIIEYFGFANLDTLRKFENINEVDATNCPVCGYKVHIEPEFAICPICEWQYDTTAAQQISLTNTDIDGSPLTLEKAAINFSQCGTSTGASPKAFSKFMRKVHDVARSS